MVSGPLMLSQSPALGILESGDDDAGADVSGGGAPVSDGAGAGEVLAGGGAPVSDGAGAGVLLAGGGALEAGGVLADGAAVFPPHAASDSIHVNASTNTMITDGFFINYPPFIILGMSANRFPHSDSQYVL